MKCFLLFVSLFYGVFAVELTNLAKNGANMALESSLAPPQLKAAGAGVKGQAILNMASNHIISWIYMNIYSLYKFGETLYNTGDIMEAGRAGSGSIVEG